MTCYCHFFGRHSLSCRVRDSEEFCNRRRGIPLPFPPRYCCCVAAAGRAASPQSLFDCILLSSPGLSPTVLRGRVPRGCMSRLPQPTGTMRRCTRPGIVDASVIGATPKSESDDGTLATLARSHMQMTGNPACRKKKYRDWRTSNRQTRFP
ncbi:hypothetical protein LX36DRAFT_324438 [Colletotrichum falcatum]|nr:hypothetical protein LX36DRAFT_324438 [Colletotrichum falcatum]